MSLPPQAVHTYVLNQKLLSLSGDMWIEDEQGNNAFQVDGKLFSLRRNLVLLDLQGNPLYSIGKSLAHLHRTFEIKRADAIVATIQEALVNFLGDHFTINAPNGDQLTVKGNFIDREFHVSDGGTDVIVASRKWLSVRDSYGIQIAPSFETALGLAIVVALEQMELEERDSRNPGGGSLGGLLPGF